MANPDLRPRAARRRAARSRRLPADPPFARSARLAALAAKAASRPRPILHAAVFDSLEQGNAAAIAGHGISIGDLALSLRTIEEGLLALPCDAAVRTGDGYYLVWPAESAKRPLIERLQAFLVAQTPDVSRAAVRFIG